MTVEQWSLMVGFFLPALVAVVNRQEWKPWIKAVAALVASVVVGTVTALLSGRFTGANWMTAIGIVFAASQLAYVTWWKNSDIAGWIERNVNVITSSKKTTDSVTVKSDSPLTDGERTTQPGGFEIGKGAN